MADNREVRVKRGETGFILNARLKDDENKLIDLTVGGTWTVTISVTVRGGGSNLLAGSSMSVRDQAAYRGQAYYILTEADALLPAGKYDLEITAIEPNGHVRKFPKDVGSVFGTLHMMESKS